MAYKSLNDLVPGYLSSKFVKRYETRYSLRDSGNKVIDHIRIPRRPWDERLHSMIARLKRGTFSKNTNKHWLVKAESLQNDRNQQKTARFKS